MKELKFKVLHKLQNKWIYSDSFLNLSRFFQKLDRCNISENSVLQFTGFKDKNGKEIYEGDTLKGYIGKGKFQFYGRVEFTDSSFSLIITQNDGRTDYDVGQTLELNCFDELEIIDKKQGAMGVKNGKLDIQNRYKWRLEEL